MARAKREVLLRVHGHRLRREDLEDCFGQATLELVAAARRGVVFASRAHVANALEQKLLSRIQDRRRALSGRSRIQAAMEYAVPLGSEADGAELRDRNPEPERLAMLRYELGQIVAAAPALSDDHAWWYVEEVESWAARYTAGDRGPAQEAPGRLSLQSVSQAGVPVIPISGNVARLDPRDGHIALIPTGAPPVVQAMLIAGNELQDLPYGPDGHPDPLGAPDEDCSSTINYILYRAGVRPLSEILAQNPLAQSYVRWGDPGPGRWVTIYATEAPTPHVFGVIAGLRIDTSHHGTDVGPNRFQDGPRWRILDHIPTWAHWSVRHPPGL